MKAASPESASKAVAVLQPLACSPEAALETKASYGRALLAADRLREAEPFLWPLIEQDPSHVQYVLRLIGEELDAGEEMQALALARRLEHQQRTAGRLRDHARAMAVLAKGMHLVSVSWSIWPNCSMPPTAKPTTAALCYSCLNFTMLPAIFSERRIAWTMPPRWIPTSPATNID